jgi:hypothetical protein
MDLKGDDGGLFVAVRSGDTEKTTKVSLKTVCRQGEVPDYNPKALKLYLSTCVFARRKKIGRCIKLT